MMVHATRERRQSARTDGRNKKYVNRESLPGDCVVISGGLRRTCWVEDGDEEMLVGVVCGVLLLLLHAAALRGASVGSRLLRGKTVRTYGSTFLSFRFLREFIYFLRLNAAAQQQPTQTLRNSHTILLNKTEKRFLNAFLLAASTTTNQPPALPTATTWSYESGRSTGWAAKSAPAPSVISTSAPT